MPQEVVSLGVAAERVGLPPGEHRLYAVVTLTASDAPAEVGRPRLVTSLALDVSGSMQGEPLAQVVRSVERIVDLLRDDDQLGVVAFSTNATEVAPVRPLSAEHRRAVKARVGRIRADERTNLEAGLRLARSIMPARVEGERHGVVLLSDGAPNVGACAVDELTSLSRFLRGDAVISSLGYGPRHHDGVLMAIADGGGGAYRFVPDPAACQLELAQSVGAQGDVAAEGIEVTLVPAPGVEISKTLGATRMHFTAEGLVVPVEDLPANAARLLAVELRVRLDAERMRGTLLTVRVAYRAAGQSAPRSAQQTLAIDVGGTEPRVDGATLAQVLLLRADEARDEARAMADRGQWEGAAAVLRGLMGEIERAPGFAAADGSPLSEAREQLLDEAMAMERRPDAEALSSFRKSTAPRRLAGSDAHASSRARGQTALTFTSAAAGLFPEAYLVSMSGAHAGTRHRLHGQNTLGRTSSADVVVPSAQVSRRHADVFAVEGEFWIADLGSTNVTLVNGRRLGSKPHRLMAGDVVQVGDAVFRYEEVAR